MRNAILTIALIISALSGGIAYYHHRSAYQATDALIQERYTRMVAEEGLLKANEKVSSLEKELASVKKQLESSEQLLKQTVALRNDLQKKLDEVIAQKESLEQKVKDLSKRVKAAAPATDGM